MTYALRNVTVIFNEVFAIVEPAFEVPFELYSGVSPENENECPETYEVPEPYIVLHGDRSYSADPNITIYYSWTQLTGEPVVNPYFCDETGVYFTSALANSTEPNALFIPPNLGLYTFQLTVTDGIDYDTAKLAVWVIPNFIQPEGPPLVLPNYTNPPIRNLTAPSRPIIQFPNYSAPYAPAAPFAPKNQTNTTVPPLLPRFPSASIGERLLTGFAFFAALSVLLLFLGFWVVVLPQDDYAAWARVKYNTF